jgi:serpin B
MADTLQFSGMNLARVNQGYLDLIGSLENVDSQLSLSIGNSVWVDRWFEPKVNKTFTGRLSTHYEGEIFIRGFADPQTVQDINGWVSDETNEKIDKIVERIEPDTVMFLLNAIYFKGDWTKKFESKTYKVDFFLDDGAIVEADFMSTLEDFSSYSGEDFKAVRLPYGRDKVAMYIFLPDEGISFDSFIAGINQADFDGYLSQFSSPSNIRVDLPKFRLGYGTRRLNDALKSLGMGVAFDGEAANFNGIARVDPENLFLSFVDHKAVIEVNEKGTEAAAATNVGIGLTAAPSYETFIVNRPFFFVIRDDRSGSILFMGKIVDPTQSVSP